MLLLLFMSELFLFCSVFGHYSQSEEFQWLVVKLDFGSVLSQRCTARDYTLWSPSDEVSPPLGSLRSFQSLGLRSVEVKSSLRIVALCWVGEWGEGGGCGGGRSCNQTPLSPFPPLIKMSNPNFIYSQSIPFASFRNLLFPRYSPPPLPRPLLLFSAIIVDSAFPDSRLYFSALASFRWSIFPWCSLSIQVLSAC